MSKQRRGTWPESYGDERDEVAELGDELFEKIEKPQGYAFFSDGEIYPTKADFFERVRGRLEWQRKGVKVMEGFLRKHKQLKP